MLRDYSSKALAHIPVLKTCLGDGVSGDGTCVGKGAVLRISFGNVMFFAVMLLLTVGIKRKVLIRPDHALSHQIALHKHTLQCYQSTLNGMMHCSKCCSAHLSAGEGRTALADPRGLDHLP